MNDPTNLPPNSPQNKPTWNVLSGALRALLLDGRSDAIARSPPLLEEAERTLPALWADARRGASPVEIAKVLSARFALFPQPDRTDGEWAAWWADYNDTLADIYPDAIEAGLAEYVRRPDSEFFPKPGKLRELALTVPNRLSRAIGVAERAVRWARREEAALAMTVGPRPEPQPADKEAVGRMLASFKREMAALAPKQTRPTLPPTSGPVDESGLTQAMRDHMRGQG